MEGAALGWLQARALANILDPSQRHGWFAATVVVAGEGWAAAAAPATLSGPGDRTSPPTEVVLPLAVGMSVTGAFHHG